jgi:outer membrane usher protein
VPLARGAGIGFVLAAAALPGAASAASGLDIALRPALECTSCTAPDDAPAEAAPPPARDAPLLLKRANECPSCALVTPSALRPGAAEAILLVSVNYEPKGEAYVLLAQDGDILLRETDFKAYGLGALRDGVTRMEGVAYVSLRGVPGLKYAFDEAKLELRILVDPRELGRRQVIDLAPKRAAGVIYPRAGGAFLNYNVTGSGTERTDLDAVSAAGELGVRLGDYLLLSDAQSSYQRDRNTAKTTRLNTSLTRDWRDTLQRMVLGDFVTSASTLGSSLRLGGISFSRRYSIDPYYLRFPGQVVSGTAALPSTIYLYNNGVLVGRQQVSPGSYELQNLVSLSGLQVTEVVVRDVLGNEQTISNPFYFTQALLREGLDEYSADLGAQREQFGVHSNDYGKLGAAGFYRRGVTDAFTLGVRGEALDRRYNAGPTATWRLGTYGVASAEVAWGDSPQGSGSALALGHSFSSSMFSSSLAWRSETRDFPRAGSDARQNRQHEFAGTFSMPLAGGSSLGLIYQDSHPWAAERSRAATLTLRHRFSGGVYLSTSLRHSNGAFGANEVLVALSYTPLGLGDQPSFSAQAQRTGNVNAQTFQVLGGNPEAAGLVYRATLQHTDGPEGTRDFLNPLLQYNFARGIARGEYFRDSDVGNGAYQLGFSGAVARVEDVWGLSRPIYDSFGMAKVEGVRNVRVYANNIDVGRTGADGTLFIPRLASYFDNPIAIEDKDLPLDTIVPQTRYIVSPPYRSGVLVDFKARRVQAVAGRLSARRAGKRVPFADAAGEIAVPGRAPLPVYAARDGSFYVEDLGPGEYRGEVSGRDGSCAFVLRVPPTKEAVADLGTVECGDAR